MRIWRRLEGALQEWYENPRRVKGSGIQFEVSFERQLIRHGIFLSKKVGYERYPNGSQKWPDFHIYDERTILPIELKSTRKDWIHLGQTWIHSDALYLIHRTTIQRIDIMRGKDMKTEEDDIRFKEFQFQMKQFKSEWDRSKTFSSSVNWSTSVDIRYCIQKEKQRNYFCSVLDDLRRL
jgi:hypothetical protein